MIIKKTFVHILENITPFFIIGLLAVIFDHNWQVISKNSIVKYYIHFTNLRLVNFPKISDSLLEHLAPNSLCYGIVILFLLCALNRLVFGDYTVDNMLIKFIINPILRFINTLAMSMIGIFLGIFAALLYYNHNDAILYLAICIYPIMYLLLTNAIFTSIVLSPSDETNWFRKKFSKFWASRIESIFIVIIAIMIISVAPIFKYFSNKTSHNFNHRNNCQTYKSYQVFQLTLYQVRPSVAVFRVLFGSQRSRQIERNEAFKSVATSQHCSEI